VQRQLLEYRKQQIIRQQEQIREHEDSQISQQPLLDTSQTSKPDVEINRSTFKSAISTNKMSTVVDYNAPNFNESGKPDEEE
jgi:hypothetical protein